MHTVLYVFGWLFVTLSAAVIVPLGIAATLQETEAAQAFLATSVITGFIGGGLILSFKEKNNTISRKESLLLAGLIWLVVPIPIALPFYFTGFPNDILKAYFEAVSGYTTTGATILADLSELPASLLFFRSFVQWLGGLSTLLFFGLILGPLTGPERVDPTLRQINMADLGTGRRFKEAAYTILPIYAGMTFCCFVALVLTQIPTFDALCLSLSTLSTGGFIPRAGTISLYGSPAAELTLTIFMFLGAVSIFWVRSVIQRQWRGVASTKEPLHIGAAILFFGLILSVPLFISSPEQGLTSLYHSFTLGLSSAASFITTTGFAMSTQTVDAIPYTVLILMCLVGGGAFSTAGGLKFFRVKAMFAMSARDLQKLRFPHGVLPTDKDLVEAKGSATSILAANFSVIIIAIIALSLILSVTDLPLTGAFLAAVSAIGNVGPAFEQSGLPELAGEVYYADLTPAGLIAICAGMIFGRVEVLALLTLFNFAYWRS